MAKKKKTRTPTPPRPVQAPKRRSDTRDMGISRRNAMYALAGAGIVVVIVLVAFFAFGGGKKGGDANADTASIAALMKSAGCTYRNVNGYLPKGQTMHKQSLTGKFPWNTDPPSNGQHYPEWAVWGFYTSAVNPRMVVHNEEHGAVVLWWGSKVSAGTVQKLKAFYLQQPIGGFGTPYPSLGGKIAITAWTGDPNRYQQNGYYGEGHIAVCSRYTQATEKAFAAFRSAYRGHGPEGIPLCDDEPGDSPEQSSC